MPRRRRRYPVQTNFSSGQLDSEMLGRVDTQIYNNGASELLNWRQLVQGGVDRRPGWLYLNSAAIRFRLMPFIFSDEQAYLIAPGVDGYIAVLDLGANEIANFPTTAYNSLEIVQRLRYTQRFDTMVLCHKDIPIALLKRTGATTFTLANLSFEKDPNGAVLSPQFRYADPGISLTVTGTGPYTLTLSSPYWETGSPNHVGVRINAQKDAETDPLNYAQYTITAVTSSTVATATAVNQAAMDTNPTFTWTEDAFSAIYGYPRACIFHGQRLWLAGPPGAPGHIWGSVAAAFFNFFTGEGLDSDAIAGPVVADQVNDIEHLASGRFLTILTDQGAFYQPETDDSPITPASFNPKQISRHGVSELVRPLRYDDQTIFAQEAGEMVRSIDTEIVTQRLEQRPISLVATDQLNDVQDGAAIYAVNERPEEFAYLVNADGTMTVYSSVKSENIRGWVPIETQGQVRSVAAINQRLYLAVERVIDQQTVFTVELQDDAVYLDAAIIKTNPTPTGSWTIPEYAKETVHVVSSMEDSQGQTHRFVNYHGTFTLGNSGELTLPDEYTTKEIVVGLNYNARGGLFPPVIEDPDAGAGASVLAPKHLVALQAHLESTLSFSVRGKGISFQYPSEDFSQPPVLYTGHVREYTLGWDRYAQVTFENNFPLPSKVIMLKRVVAA